MSQGTRRVAVIAHRFKDQPWGLLLRAELQAGLADHPEIQLEFADPEGDADAQVRLIEECYRAGVDALVVMPLDVARVEAALRRHAQFGVPVIALDNELSDPALCRTMILADNRQFGRKMGEFFVEVTGGVADLVEIRGIPSTSGARDRAEGFREAIAGTRVRIVESLVGNWVHAQARQALAEALPRHPRLDGVFAHNDEMAHGAWDAAEAAGRAGELLITGVDAMKGERGLQLIMQGRLAATLLNPSPGRPAARALLAVLAGEQCLPKTLLQTSMLRSNERIRAWQAARGPRR